MSSVLQSVTAGATRNAEQCLEIRGGSMESSNEVHEAADELPTVTVDFGTADGSATWFVESGIDAVAETLTPMLGPPHSQQC